MTKGGLVWFKDKGNAASHRLVDTERGNTKELNSDNISANATHDGLDSFLSTGILVGDDTDYNTNTNKYVAWNFRSAPGFFDVVKFTGSGSGSARAISHNLGCKPGMMICKNADNASGVWVVYHKHVTAGGQDAEDSYMLLSETNAESTIGSWGNTAPTADNFYVSGASGDYALDASGDEYICYLFADGTETDAQVFGDGGDEEIVKVGTYTGTEGNLTPTIDLGWEPQYVLMKKKESGSTQRDWVIADKIRGVYNPDIGSNNDRVLYANTNAAESTIRAIAFNANGFSLMSDEQSNDDTYDYLYLAIRNVDSKVGKVEVDAATDVFAMDFGASSSVQPNYDANFPVDMSIVKKFNATESARISSRMYYTDAFYSDQDDSLVDDIGGEYDCNKGFGEDSKDSNYIAYMWKKFPGFFDQVWWKGNGSSRTISHNLGSQPKMIWVKNLSTDGRSAYAYIDPSIGGSAGNTKGWRWDDNGVTTSSDYWNNTTATSSVFTVNSSNSVNDSGDYYSAFIFGEVAGLSKFGNFNGTNPGGGDTTIDCGFQPRFLILKRLDSSGNWYIFDTLRDSFNSSDRRYLMINYSYGESQPDHQWVSLTASGFKIEDNSDNDINESGMNIMYYAIA